MDTPGFSLTLDAADPERLARFWCDAFGYVVAAGPTDEMPDAQLTHPGGWPDLFLQRVPEPKVAKNRLHVDVAVGGAGPKEQRRARIDAEAVRLKGLGASDHRGAQDEADGYWVRMNDPEGNEFCLV
jgi:hypothetical protein